jgi:hypothetical protein
MIPIVLLHAILLWQQGHSNAEPWRDMNVQQTQALPSNCAYNYLHEMYCAPVQTGESHTTTLTWGSPNCSYRYGDGGWMPCPAQEPFDVPPVEKPMPELGGKILRYCEDNSRYLLEREDATWHCLALTGKP